MIFHDFSQKVFFMIAMILLVGCAAGPQPPEVGEIDAKPSTTIMTGQKANLTIPVSGTESTFEWSSQSGTLSDPAQPAVIYTAPDAPGFDTVTVKINYKGGQIIRSITFEVVAAAVPTDTSLPEDVPTATVVAESTATPEPIVCNLPPVTKNLFPQLVDVNGQYPIYGPLGDTNIVCEAVYDIVHTPGKMAVHFKYTNVGANFGWWGIATPNGYDASKHSQLCFWAYAQKPNQSFRVKMKDTTAKEKGDPVTIETTNQWTQICTPISKFQELGIKVDKMDNINLGFEQPTGSAEIWIADFEFK